MNRHNILCVSGQLVTKRETTKDRGKTESEKIPSQEFEAVLRVQLTTVGANYKLKIVN